jgi:hypothetical protein
MAFKTQYSNFYWKNSKFEKDTANNHQSDTTRLDSCYISTSQFEETAKNFATIYGVLNEVS